MPLKITIMYNQQGRGWSEVFYEDEATLPFAIPTTHMKILSASFGLRNDQTVIYGIRYSQTSGDRKSIFFNTQAKFAAASNISPAAPDVITTDALYNIRGQAFTKRTISIRGIDDDAVRRHPVFGIDMPSAEFDKAVGKYLQAVSDAHWQIRWQQNPNNNPALKYYDMLLVQRGVFQGGNVGLVSTGQPLLDDFVPGDVFRTMGRYKSYLPGFPRVNKVLGLDNTGIKKLVVAYVPRGTEAIHPEKVKIVKVAYNYSAITSWDFGRFSERKTGRPFGMLRGRSRAIAFVN